MNNAPTRSAIFSAESKLAQSRRDTVEGFCRLRSGLRSRLARPSSLALAVGIAALIGFWLVLRKPSAPHAGKATSTSMAGLAVALLIRWGWQRFAGLLRDSWASGYPDTGTPLPEEHSKGLARQR